jgi:hypothetical protein
MTPTQPDPHRRAVATVLAKAGVRGRDALSEHERRIYDAVHLVRDRRRPARRPHAARPTI